MSRPKTTATLNQLARPAARQRVEGYELPMTTSRVDGEVTAFGVDISDAPVPQREFAAEACTVIAREDEAWLYFWQATVEAELDLTECDALLIIRMNAQAARQMASSIDEMKQPSAQEIADRMGIKASELPDVPRRARQTGRMIANLTMSALSGYEGCIDFYRASPFAFKELEHTNRLAVEPVVRVDLRTAQFLALYERLKLIADKLPRSPGETQRQAQ